MEMSLSQRFSRVANRFGKGLLSLVKGSILGLSIGLLNKLLNPIQELEDKIKALLEEGKDIKDTAESLGASVGEVRRLQDIGVGLGVKPEDTIAMTNKFGQVLEDAAKEIENLKPGEELSSQAQAVKNFVGRENVVQAFQDFLAGLRTIGAGPSREITTASGIVKSQSGLEQRQAIEREVFGEKLRGGQRRLVEKDLSQVAGQIGIPGIKTLDQSLGKLASLSEAQRISEARRNTQDLIAGSQTLDNGIVAAMERRAGDQQKELTARLKSYEDTAKTAEFLNEIIKMLKDISDAVMKGARELTEMMGNIKEIRKSGVWRSLWNMGKGK